MELEEGTMSPRMSAPSRLDRRAVQRVEGPAFEAFRPMFFEVARVLLDQGPETESELTTIYVKFRTKPLPDGRVFAVAWIKNSQKLTVGLAIPQEFAAVGLIDPPRGYVYRGLTKFMQIPPEAGLPNDFESIAAAAFEAASGETTLES